MPKGSRRTTNIGRTRTGSRTTRIVMGQNPERPFKWKTRAIIAKSKLNPDPSWWILHRRGFKRPQVGQNQLEARAIPKSVLKGTLPERIVFKWLTVIMHMTDGIEFSFQSSLDGGRLELGGIVVDFLFEPQKFIIQVQGPTHDQFFRMKKDEEQRSILEQMGYRIEYLDMDDIYNEPRFEWRMRQIFNLGFSNWGGEVQGPHEYPDEDRVQNIYDRISNLYSVFSSIGAL